MIEYLQSFGAYWFLFLFTTVIWFWLYDKVMTRGISLSENLFTKDNPIAGLEFAGMLFAFFYLMVNMISGKPSSSLWTDLWHSGVELGVGMIIFMIGRGILAVCINKFNPYKDQEDVKLNNEVYVQKNWAAALASLALIVTLANAVTKIDFFGQVQWWQSMIEVGVVVLGTLLLIKVYYLFREAFKELFIKDNPAFGVSFLGMVVSFNIMLHKALKPLVTYTWAEISSSLVMLGVTLVGVVSGVLVLSGLMRVLLKKSLKEEIYEDKNIGAAFIQSSLVVGITIVMVNLTF